MNTDNQQKKKYKAKSKCKCETSNNKPFCKRCSVVKAFIGLKNGYDHLKIRNQNTGRLYAPYWYSFYSKNNKQVETIISTMRRRIEEHYGEALQTLTFYENKPNGQELAKYRY